MRVIVYTKPAKKLAKFWWIGPLGVGVGIGAVLMYKAMKK